MLKKLSLDWVQAATLLPIIKYCCQSWKFGRLVFTFGREVILKEAVMTSFCEGISDCKKLS